MSEAKAADNAGLSGHAVPIGGAGPTIERERGPEDR